MRYDAVVIGGGRSGCAEALRRASDGQKVCLVAAGLTLHSLEPELKGKPYAELHALTKAGIAVLRGDTVELVRWEATASNPVRGSAAHPSQPDGWAPPSNVAEGGTPLGGSTSQRTAALSVKTANGITLEAAEFVLATGRFFSRGLVADMEGVREPLFGADVDFPADRSKWFDPDFFAPQPFESFGVKTDKAGKILKDGKPVENVYAVGKILGGKHDAGR